ncbi:MAG TPA: neutral/alkaline non-lysosomal ceramidase N-terminal domain-containing protein [Blastocatellia bacterium]|nr:neutral/alkaline non-lysosomal ceramidase N-terminal domain-containing protein [Blastocatellia bacterium]
MKPLPRIALFVLFWCSLNAAGFADELSAGVSRVEITPPVGHPMGGYANRQGPSTGVHDPLYATALVLKVGAVTVAMVSCDLRSFPSERVVTVARERRLANHVLIAVTHNHSGPLTWEDQSWPGGGRSWFAETEQKILSAIEDAAGKMFPARIAAGFGEIYLGHNRRRVGPDGKVTMLWRNAEKSPTGPLDPIVGVMRIDDATGTPRAIIVNYACHAVVLGPDNRMISADYPGYLARRVEREFAGALCMFTQGGAGDINPYLDKQPVDQNGFGEAEKMGNALAEEAVKVARRLKPQPNALPALRAAAEVVEFRDRWDKNKTIRAGLTTLLINSDIAIATLPGEPFVDLQIGLRDKSEFRNTFLFGYTYSAGGEWVGYIPTIQAAAEGGYGAGYNTRLEVGAGEAMIDRAVIQMFSLAGKLKDSPGR